MNRFTFFYWFVASSLYLFVHFFGTEAIPVWDRGRFSYVIVAFLSALFLGLVNSFLFKSAQKLKMLSYMSLIFLKALIVTCSFILLIFCLKVSSPQFESDSTSFLNDLMMPQKVSALVYLFVSSCLYSFLMYLRSMIGKQTMSNIMWGKYRQAQNEKRIFMFLDLKSSTTHGEKLGNEKFAALIQDCFKDLKDAAIKYHVDIYSYVGDEVILTWDLKKGVERGNCLKCFFAFNQKLQEKKEYYLKHYDIVPEFKAGAHVGEATVVQIGNSVKTSIDYLGDVMNTCARIEGECNTYKKNILISEELVQLLQNQFHFDALGAIALRGKSKVVKVYYPSSYESQTMQKHVA